MPGPPTSKQLLYTMLHCSKGDFTPAVCVSEMHVCVWCECCMCMCVWCMCVRRGCDACMRCILWCVMHVCVMHVCVIHVCEMWLWCMCVMHVCNVCVWCMCMWCVHTCLHLVAKHSHLMRGHVELHPPGGSPHCFSIPFSFAQLFNKHLRLCHQLGWRWFMLYRDFTAHP